MLISLTYLFLSKIFAFIFCLINSLRLIVRFTQRLRELLKKY